MRVYYAIGVARLVLTLGSAVAVEVPGLAVRHLAGYLDQAVGPLAFFSFLP